MRTIEEITAERDKIARIARLKPTDAPFGQAGNHDGTAPAPLVARAQSLVHVLSWVLAGSPGERPIAPPGEPQMLPPFGELGGCCCANFRHDAQGRLLCGFGNGLCLAVGHSPQPPLDPAPSAQGHGMYSYEEFQRMRRAAQPGVDQEQGKEPKP